MLCLFVAACGTPAANVAGVWEGTWTGTDGQSTGRFKVDVTQRGKTIGGRIELGLDWLPHAAIDGVVEGQTVRWGVLRERLVVITFEGLITQDTAEGTYRIGTETRGSWNARRTARAGGRRETMPEMIAVRQ